MNYRNFVAGAMAFALAAAAAGCGDKPSGTSEPVDTSAAETTAAEDTTAETSAEESSEEETELERTQPTPTDTPDENAFSFDDGDFSFAEIISDDDQSAVGELSVEEVMGNKMLKFTDDNSVPLDGKVQKVKFNAAKMIGLENLPKVRRIEFDLYAKATADHFVNEDGDSIAVPGWIGGGGGTVTAKDDKWYDFGEFTGGEYDFELSGAVHGEFKFLLADSGVCWSEEMEDANFLIMRWGLSNEADLYIDNIVFYDEDGNSIPASSSEASEEADVIEEAED